MITKNVLISEIQIDTTLQPRVAMDMTTIDEYTEIMREAEGWGDFPPIKLINDNGHTFWLWDGFHRVQAAKNIGLTIIPAEIEVGTKNQALWESFSANKNHGLKRSQADKKRAVEAALINFNSHSDRAIAKHVGVSHPLVAKVREELVATGKITSETIRTDANGREINTANIGKSITENLEQSETDMNNRLLDALGATGKHADEAWQKAQETGLTNRELQDLIGRKFGHGGGSSGPNTTPEWHIGGNNPRWWYKQSSGRGKPTLQGTALINKVRELLEIPLPKQPQVETLNTELAKFEQYIINPPEDFINLDPVNKIAHLRFQLTGLSMLTQKIYQLHPENNEIAKNEMLKRHDQTKSNLLTWINQIESTLPRPQLTLEIWQLQNKVNSYINAMEITDQINALESIKNKTDDGNKLYDQISNKIAAEEDDFKPGDLRQAITNTLSILKDKNDRNVMVTRYCFACAAEQQIDQHSIKYSLPIRCDTCKASLPANKWPAGKPEPMDPVIRYQIKRYDPRGFYNVYDTAAWLPLGLEPTDPRIAAQVAALKQQEEKIEQKREITMQSVLDRFERIVMNATTQQIFDIDTWLDDLAAELGMITKTG